MSLISQEQLQEIDFENLSPQQIEENLVAIPDLVSFLNARSNYLQKSRPVVLLALALCVQTFRQASDQPMRQMPAGLLEQLWQKFSMQGYGSHASEMAQNLEPYAWELFLNLSENAYQQESWTHSELAAAGLVFATVLVGLIYMFWPTEDLEEVIQVMQDLQIDFS